MKKEPTIALITAAVLSAASLAFADGDRAVPPWERGEQRRDRAAIDTRPDAQLPGGLQRAPVAAGRASARTEIAATSGSLDRRILADARRAAEAQVAGPGVRNYFRVGFHQGMLEALNDDRLGRRDFRQGLRHGSTDREATRIGRRLGSDAAFDLAVADAEQAVATRFRDLGSEPRFDPTTSVPEWVAPRVDFDAPAIRDLLIEYPLPGFASLRREFDLYLLGWEWDAARLFSCGSYTEFYTRDWDSANRAFHRWRGNPRNERLLRGLTSGEVDRLRALFANAFVRRIDRLTDAELMPAWSLGLDRGWDYGAFIRQELDYRAGFAKGFRQQAALVAKAVFRSAYAREFETAYAASFDRWSTSAVPAIGTVRLLDGNDDGVFEPGEQVIADVELINYGGVDGRFVAGIDGSALAEIDSEQTRVPRRSSVVRRGLLEAVIDGSIRPRTHAVLTVRLGDETRDVRLAINRPLEWVNGSLRLSRDNLGGHVRVELDVRNISRHERRAEVSLATNRREAAGLSQVLPLVRPRDAVTVRFDVDGLSPLALIGGRVVLDLFLDADGVEQDRMSANLAGTATDLSSRDLPRLLRRLIAEGATPVETAEARELVLARLRADWRAAVRANGNPYKLDYRSGGDLTALGQLVQLASGPGARSGDGDLLAGLSADVLTLAHDLPGPHPLLRKYVKRLARRLP